MKAGYVDIIRKTVINKGNYCLVFDFLSRLKEVRIKQLLVVRYKG